ncbi:MAG: pyruvate formate lyase family protein [Clostridia bacterium]|nr:pyruvate formate lyase family protein [Clostridia bacterium]
MLKVGKSEDLNEKRKRYQKRLDLLRETKEKQTQEKVQFYGYMDEDDYGTVLPPKDFKWEPKSNHIDGSFYGAKAWGENFRDLMEKYPVYVDPVDAIAGRTVFFMSRYRKNLWKPEFDYSFLKADHEKYNILHGIGSESHFVGDYRIGLKLGWGGLLKKVRHYSEIHGEAKKEFYEAEENIILGVQAWVRHNVEAIKKLKAIENNPEYKQNLQEMEEANEWLIENPPRTLREACQWIACFNDISRTYNRDGAGGQIDEILKPYYENDVANGFIDDEDAIFIIACLLLNDPNYYQLGGPGHDGKDMTSHISFLIMEAAHRLGVSVNLTIRVHDGLDKELFERSVKYLFEDRKGWPRYSGDKALTEGFANNGYSIELARERIAVGCHWMAIPGREYCMNDNIKINVAKVFEIAFYEMADNSSMEKSLDVLWSLFEKHLYNAVLCTAKGIDFHLAYQKDNEPELVLNLICYGPIEKGLDASDKGLEFYNIGVDGAGIATVADSLAALEQRIVKEKAITWEEVTKQMRSNYAGAEGERIRLMLKHSERYGQGDSLGDKWAVKVSKLFSSLVKKNHTPNGVNMIPGWFSWSQTILLGKSVGATPDGRHDGDPINHGANPNNGFRKDGAITSMSNSIAAIQCGYGNTAPFQLEFDPKTTKVEGGLEKISSIIKTHFELGGTLININIIDADKIRAAHKDPSQFPDLIVRVTGFTSYFITLSPEFRQLVLIGSLRDNGIFAALFYRYI